MKWFKWATILGLVASGLALVGYWGLVFYFESRLPEVFKPQVYEARTTQLTRVFSGDGEVLAEWGENKRTIAAPEDIPKLVKYAVLAAEDADFYKHDGLDYFGMARAMYKNLRDQRFSQGASTITQQVAKTFYLTSEKTIARKLKEVVLARQLEQKLTKDEILYLYLNQIYWGHGRYGVWEASRHYFGKPPKALSLADAALLAGLIAAPERFSPFRDLRKATERRAFVIDQMAAKGWIKTKDASKAKRRPIRLNFRGDPHIGLAGYAVDGVRKQVLKHVGAERLQQGGLRVYATVDSKMQAHAERAVRQGLVAIDRHYKLATPLKRISKRRIKKLVGRWAQKIPAKGIKSGKIVRGVVVGVDSKRKAYLVNYGMGPGLLPFKSLGRYKGRLQPGELYRLGDVLRVSPKLDTAKKWRKDDKLPILNLEQGPQAALIAIEPKTRHIKAMVGGFDHMSHPFNRTTQARRQAGSTFKPLVYAAGMEIGRIDPLTRIRNVPESYRMGPGRYWKPRNFDGKYDGRNYTLRAALAKSINIIAVKVLEKFVGVSRFIDFARRIGIKSDIKRDYSIALGSTAISPMELTNAYATLASSGSVQDPILLTRIEDHHGKVLYQANSKKRRGTTAKVAFRTTEMMQAVVENGTGKVARNLGRHAAGKTGTTDKGIDNWFAGYTPDLAASIWIGFDDRRPLKKASGGKLAAPIWTRFMTGALEGRKVTRFRPPRGVTQLPPMESPSLAHREANTQTLRSGQMPRKDSARAGVELLYE